MPVQPSAIYMGTAAVGGCVAAVCDLRTRRIPNSCNAVILIAGLALHVAFEGWPGLASALSAALVAFSLFLVFFLAGGMGGGDVKLMAALGAVVGLPHVAVLLLATAASGGLLAVIVVLVRQRTGRTLHNLLLLLQFNGAARVLLAGNGPPSGEAPLYLPYGVAIAAGTILVFACHAYSLFPGK